MTILTLTELPMGSQIFAIIVLAAIIWGIGVLLSK